MHRIAAVVLLIVMIALLVSACSAAQSTATAEGGAPRLAPESALPDFVRNSAPQVKEAYRFAAANPEALSQYPCYCGCGAMGHQSNLNCYIKEIPTDGSIVFDNHAVGCSICVDIARDVMRLMAEGRRARDIRTYIDATYSRYGPPTNTQPVQ